MNRDGPIALPVALADSALEELAMHYREVMAGLAAGSPPHERGKLHLAIGVHLDGLDDDHLDEAIEELRQALALLPEEDGRLDHAEARHHLGRLLLKRVLHMVKDDRVIGGRATIREAAHHLERAHRLFTEESCTASRVEATRLWCFALALSGRHDQLYALLERERVEHEGEHRIWIELCLAEHALEDPDLARQAQGADILASYLDQAGSAPAGTNDAFTSILGMHAHLPAPLVSRALSWLESRPETPSDLLISLRARVHRDHPERWLTPSDKTRLVGTMDDPAAPIATRANAAYTLLGVLPKHDTVLQRRVVEQLESWIESPDIHPLHRDSYRHDLGLAMRMIADGDPSLLERAIHHLGIALDEFASTSAQPMVARNLAFTLFELLKIRAAVSSPALLLPLAMAIEALAPELPSKSLRDLRLGTADCLLRCHVLTHPKCAAIAAALIGTVLVGAQDDVDAHRMRYLHAWILHAQGTLEQKTVDQFLERARELGEVPALEQLDNELTSVARALAGNGSLEGLDLRPVVAAARMRPDAVELVLDEVESRFGIPGIITQDRRALLAVAIDAVTVSAPGDEGARGRRLAALFVQSAPHLARSELVHLVRMTLSPARSVIREALQTTGISLDESAYQDAGGVDVGQRAQQLHARGIELMQQGQRSMIEHDESAAKKFLHDAQRILDEACALVRCLPVEDQAKVQISAGNARRHLAKLDADRAAELLEQAEALYRQAWPWTEGDKGLRAQLAKVLADCLFQRYGADRWAETTELYSAALAGRPGGFKRMETLLAMAEAELVCPNRARPANLIAALGRLEEALDHTSREDENRRMMTLRALSLLRELANGGHIDSEHRVRIAQRIANAAPDLANDARLATYGLGIELEVDAKERPEDACTNSEFVQALVKATNLIHPLQTIESFPPHLRDMARKAVESGKITLGEKGIGDAVALRNAVERLRHPVAGEGTQARAGRLVGRAQLIEKLQEFGDDAGEARLAACHEAESAAHAIEDHGIRGVALSALAGVWQYQGPGGDFTRSARMLEEALSLIPAHWPTSRADANLRLGRALRYREDVPTQQAIEMAIPIYQEAAELYRKIGFADGIAQVLQNLSEAVGARQDRPRAVALREALFIERQAIALARTAHASPLPALLANHAYGLTLLAQAPDVPPDEAKRSLEEAAPLFEEAARLNTDPAFARVIENNRLIWRSVTAKTRGDREGIRADLRERLRKLDSRTQSRDWSMAAHNLADELVERPQGAADLREALDLLRRALVLRPIDAEPRFHWETAWRLGHLLASLRGARNRLDLSAFRLSATAAREQAIEYFRSALVAARSLGPGFCMVRTARALGLLAADVAPDEMPDLPLAAVGLSALEEVLALLPEDRGAAEAEAEVAGAMAATIARYRANTAVIHAVTATDATVLHGGAAWEVLHWMLRARGGQHRRLRARMIQPEGVPGETWTRWRLALRGRGNWNERRDAAQAVRQLCSSFLAGEPDLTATRAWMNATGAAAALLLETRAGWLLGVIAPAPGKDVADGWVVLLGGEPPSITLSELMQKLRAPDLAAAEGKVIEQTRTAEAWRTLDDLVRWFQAHVLRDLRERIPAGTRTLLWSPHGVAAVLPLGLVWEDLPSIWTTPCLTRPPPRRADATVSSALLLLAEPSDQPSIEGEQTIAGIARALAGRLDRVEVLLGRGCHAGHAVAGTIAVPGLVPDVAPTPDEVKRRLPDHRLIVILAHGRYEESQPEKSAVCLIGPDGASALLSADSLSDTPDRLRNAIVVLLSCETGAAGQLSAAPAGLAGVLLAVGAAAVVAPLWPVQVDHALRVGERIALAVACGIDLGEAVQTAMGLVRAELGENARKDAPYGLGPFVVWTG